MRGGIVALFQFLMAAMPLGVHASVLWQSADGRSDEIPVYSTTTPRWYEQDGMQTKNLGVWNRDDFTTTASTSVHVWLRWNGTSFATFDVGLMSAIGGDPFSGAVAPNAKILKTDRMYYAFDASATSTLQEYVLPVLAGQTIRNGDGIWAFLYSGWSGYGASHWVGGTALQPFIEICEGTCANDVPPPPPDPCIAAGNCVSNVLFLPGIEGSRLYEGSGCGQSGEEKLWEPYDGWLKALFGVGNGKINKLALDTSGASACADIYTKSADIIDSVGNSNLYKSFIDQMDSLKSDGTIKNWIPVAYDWRLSFDDLLSRGTERDGKIYYEEATSTPYIEQTLRALAANSKTGKVSIVTHSNGGLLAKALLNKLGSSAESLVDKVIMVGVPQSGAPAAVGSLLVGYDAGIYKYGVPVVSNTAARSFTQNAPMAYHLLPSEDYLESTAGDAAHPVARFTGDAYAKEEEAYGATIANRVALDDYLLAKEGGRVDPAPNDLKSAEIANAGLIEYANRTHSSLDGWTPPAGIEVDQIAGWGVDTVAGIDFYTSPKDPVRSYRPIFTEDGDGTVPVPSALMIASSTNVKRYWLTLDKINNIPGAPIKYEHKNLFEVQSIREFINKVLINDNNSLPAYVSVSQPVSSSVKKLTFFLHSPLTLQINDSWGNTTGLAQDGSVTEDIPNSVYGEFGEVKYVTVPVGDYKLTMHGQDTGTFSLDMQESFGGVVTSSATLAGVPVTSSTLASLTIAGGLDTATELTIDENGDGASMLSVVPQIGETIVYEPPIAATVAAAPANAPPAPAGSISIPVVLPTQEPVVATTSAQVIIATTSPQPEVVSAASSSIVKKDARERWAPVPVVEAQKSAMKEAQTAAVIEATSQQPLMKRLITAVYNKLYRFWIALTNL